MENQIVNKKPFLILLLILLAVIILTASILLRNKNFTNNNEILSVTPTLSISPITSNITAKGSLRLVSVAVNNLITLNVMGDSNGSAVSGYDLVLNYDENAVSFVNQKAINDDFQIIARNSGGKLSLTGAKKINLKTDAVFNNNTPLVELNFKPLKKGKVNFSILYDSGSKKYSNIIDNHNEQVLGKVEGIEIDVN